LACDLHRVFTILNRSIWRNISPSLILPVCYVLNNRNKLFAVVQLLIIWFWLQTWVWTP